MVNYLEQTAILLKFSEAEGVSKFAKLQASDKAALNDIADAAIAARDVNPMDLVEMSIMARDRYVYSVADKLAQAVLDRDPGNPFAWYEIAVSRMLQGNHWDAMISVEELLKLRPDEVRVVLLQAKLAVLIGDRAKARAGLERLRWLDPTDEEIVLLPEFSDFYEQYPPGVAQYLCRRKEMSKQYIDTPEIETLARAALEARKGFTLLRMGDGEGAFVFLSEEDEARYPKLYAWNRHDRARVWFGDDIDLERNGFNALARGFRDVVARADVIGMPYATWFQHEYKIGSMTGISTLVNLARMCERPEFDAGQFYTRQDVHLRMERRNVIRNLLGLVDKVGLIGCFPQLPDYLKETFGVREVEFFKVPGEKLFLDIIGADAVEGVHFPDRYEEVMRALSEDLSGRLFLVAAGFLGKFYCDRIKRSNGVAIDIGSIVDLWLGLETRPVEG